MASLRVRIGAVADQRSFDIVFGQLEKRGDRAAAAVAKRYAQLFKLIELRGTKAAAQIGKAMAGGGPTGRRGRLSGDDMARPAIEGARKATAAISLEVRKRIAAEKAETMAWFRIKNRLEEKAARDRLNAVRRANRAAEREEAAALRNFAHRTSHRATRFLAPNAPIGSMAARGMGSLARGAGVMWDVGGLSSTITNQQRIATTISNKAFLEGEAGAAGVRVDPAQLVASARDLAKRYGGGGTENILQGALAFVNQRGNLAGWNAIAEPLLQRAVAQGADISEVGLTAAKIDSMLSSQGEFATDDDLRNKAIISMLDNLIRQGKVGSIDFDAMAREIPKLSGIAPQIDSTDPVKALTQLMTVAQLAERGPAKNSATASIYAQNFGLALPKQAQAFKDVAGIDIEGMSLEDIMVQTMLNTEQTRTMTAGRKKGQTLTQNQQLLELMPLKQARLAFAEFQNVFKGAGGGEAGAAAIRAEFAKFAGTDKQLESDLDQVFQTTANKAERFNAELEDVTDNLMQGLLPSLQNAAPAIVDFTNALSRAVAWGAENPGKAAAGAIGLSIARAGIESTMRAAIDKAIMAGGPALVKALGTSIGGALAMAGLGGLVIGTAYVTIESFLSDSTKKQQEAVDREMSFEDRRREWRQKADAGELTIEDWSAIRKELLERTARLGTAEDVRRDLESPLGQAKRFAEDYFGDMFGFDTAGAQGMVDAQQIGELKASIEEMKDLLRRPLRTTVTNFEDMPTNPAGALPAGRAAAPVPGP